VGCNTDINIGDKHHKSNIQLRHNVVMFGEMPYKFKEAQHIISQTDILIVIGSSLSVYPAAGLVLDSKPPIKYYIDSLAEDLNGFICIKEKSTVGIKQVIEQF
jgi:NAD-dependent deacetylase